MLSRIADTVYWMGRYMERTSGMLQAIRINYIASQDEVLNFSWKALLHTYGDLSAMALAEVERDSLKVMEHLLLDRMNAASAINNITQGRENARAIQDHITREVWQCLNDYYHLIREPALQQQLRAGDPVSAIDILIKQGLLFNGTSKNTLSRDECYTYLHIGKFLERAIHVADMVRIKFGELVTTETQMAPEIYSLRYLLYSLFGFEVYMKVYKGNFNADNVLDLLLYSPYFPHSLLYSLHQLHKYFERLKPESLPESYEQLEFLIGKAMNNAKYSNVVAGDTAALNKFLIQTRNELIEIGSAFSKYYFGNS